MFDDFFFGIAKFEDCNSFVNFANKVGYKDSSQWRLPSMEDLKSHYPFDPTLNFPELNIHNRKSFEKLK